MLFDIIRQSIDNLRLHKRWAALTMFGTIWGTASVILLVGWGVGSHEMTERGMQKVGKNLLFIFPGRIGEDLSPADERRTIELELDDVDALRGASRRLEILSAETMDMMLARSRSTSKIVDVRGIEPAMASLRGVRIAAGRFITPDDVRFRRRVAIIGVTARQRLLGPRPAVGARISLNGQSFEIVGLLHPVGAQLNRMRTLIDEQVWIPATAAMTIRGNERIDLIVARPPRRELNKAAKGEVRALLAKRLHVSPLDQEAVFIVSLIDFLSGFDAIFSFMNVFLVLLGGGTLAIGGIGVMNMMLVSVNERRREIGLRMAVGGSRSQIVSQFMIETLVIVLLGGAAGVTLGVLSCILLGMVPGDLVPVPHIVPEVVVLAVVTTMIVGMLSGAVPAWRAARVDPADSLRAE